MAEEDRVGRLRTPIDIFPEKCQVMREYLLSFLESLVATKSINPSADSATIEPE